MRVVFEVDGDPFELWYPSHPFTEEVVVLPVRHDRWCKRVHRLLSRNSDAAWRRARRVTAAMAARDRS